MKRVDKSKIVKSSRGIVDCVTYTVRSYVNGGKMGVWKHNLNKIVEREASIDSPRIEDELKKQFLLKVFASCFSLE